jgi:hypothetical protein
MTKRSGAGAGTHVAAGTEHDVPVTSSEALRQMFKDFSSVAKPSMCIDDRGAGGSDCPHLV